MKKNTIFSNVTRSKFARTGKSTELTQEEMLFKASLNTLNCSFINGQSQNIALGSGIARASSLGLALEMLPNAMKSGLVDMDVVNHIIVEGLVRTCRDSFIEFKYCKSEDLVNKFIKQQSTALFSDIFPIVDGVVIVNRTSDKVAYELLCGGCNFSIPENVEMLARAVPHISRWSSESCIDIQNLIAKGVFKTIDNGLRIQIVADARAEVKFSIEEGVIESSKRIKGEDNSLVVKTPLGSVADKVVDYVCTKGNKIDIILDKIEKTEDDKVNDVLTNMVDKNECGEQDVITAILQHSIVEKEIGKLIAANLSDKIENLEKEDKDVFFQARKDIATATKNCILGRIEAIDPVLLGKLTSIAPCYSLVQDIPVFSANKKFKTSVTKALDDFIQFAITGEKSYSVPVKICDGSPINSVGFLIRGVDHKQSVITDSIYTGNVEYKDSKAYYQKIIDLSTEADLTLIDMVDLEDVETAEEVAKIDKLLDLGLVRSYTADSEVVFKININGYSLDKEARDLSRAIISALFSKIEPLSVGDVIDNPYGDGEIEITSVSSVQNVCYIYNFELV